MAGLQRSALSFRRQGSSGLVWDDKFLTQELNQKQQHDQQQEQQRGQQVQEKLDVKQDNDVRPTTSSPAITVVRSRSTGSQRGHRTGRVSPAIEPPSPRVSACGFCGAFGKPAKVHRKKAPNTRPRQV